MVQKTGKKKNQLPSEKQPTLTPKPWPNLPPQLTSTIARQPNLMQNITSFGCVTKSWRSPPSQCTPAGQLSPRPRLVEINSKERDEHKKTAPFYHTVEISFHEEYPYCYYKRRSYNNYWCPGIYFKGHSHGQIVVMADNMSDCYLWEPARQCTRYLPPWDRNITFKTCTLSSSPKDLNICSVMVLTGTSSPAFAFCKWGSGHDRAWNMEDCKIKELYESNKNYMQFTNAIGFQGKFYALSLQGSLVEIGEIDSCFRITRIGGNRAVPSGVSRQFREYLVELDGEILLVFLMSRKSIDVVEDVEVFRLDIPKLLWVKIGSLGERALFLEDECCMGIAARRLGCKKNCVYFTHHRVDEWWIFDMEIGNILPAFGASNPIQESEMWDEPMGLA